MPTETNTGQPEMVAFPNELIRAAVITRREINNGDNIVHDPHIISATKLGPGEGELEFVKNNKRFALRGDKAGELSGVNFFSNPMLGALLTCEFGEKDEVEVVKVEYPVFENMSVKRVYDIYMPVEMAAELLVKTAEMCGVSGENLRESTEWLRNNNKLKGDSPGVEFIMEKVQENIWKVEGQAPIAEEPVVIKEEPVVVEEAQEIKEEPVVKKAEVKAKRVGKPVDEVVEEQEITQPEGKTEQLKVVKRRNKELENEVKNLNKALDEAKRGSNNNEAPSKDQQEELTRTKAELERVKAAKDQVTATMMAQTRELGTMAQENARLEADRKALADKSAQLAEKLNKNENGDSKTAEKVSQAEERAKAAEARAAMAEGRERSTNENLAKAEERAKNAETELAQAKERGDGRERIEELENNLRTANEIMVEKAKAFELERARAEGLREKLDQAESLIVSQRGVMDNLRAELELAKNAKGSDPEAKQKIDNLTSQKNQAVLMVRSEQTRAKNAEDEVARLKDELKKLQDKKGGSSKEDKATINALNATLQDAAKRLGELNEQLGLAQRDRDTAQRGQQTTAAENQDLRSKLMAAERERDQARRESAFGGRGASDRENDTLRSERDQAREELRKERARRGAADRGRPESTRGKDKRETDAMEAATKVGLNWEYLVSMSGESKDAVAIIIGSQRKAQMRINHSDINGADLVKGERAKLSNASCDVLERYFGIK